MNNEDILCHAIPFFQLLDAGLTISTHPFLNTIYCLYVFQTGIQIGGCFETILPDFLSAL